MSNVDTTYVSRAGSSFARMARFIRNVVTAVKSNEFDVVFIKYFAGCFLLRVLCPKVTFVFDIRTADVSGSKLKRKMKDKLMKLESYFFPYVSIISDSLRVSLGYGASTYILPLGAEMHLIQRVKRANLHLLYVGTLSGRDLEKTIYGLKIFVDSSPESDIRFTIVGEGWGDERKNLEQLAASLGLADIVHFKGFIHHSDLLPILSECNVGVAFVPITSYFDNQPVTKTFEYLLSGMPVIATATHEHRKIINDCNGVLISDTAQDFASSLFDIENKIKTGSINVRPDDYIQHSWKEIVGSLRAFLTSIKG